ncbi:hypothetical protein [Paenibacillus thermotolerans]|uniref:hypothetical protein n=1 Tax=Paenibacillus thermotolerans TaxID=3027807 RepID=UPI002368A335|nr:MULTISPECIES: hypothetical protein [unclassified Paenibacillus]
MKKWFSFTTWARVAAKTVAYLRSPLIPLWEKALLLVPVAAYWVLPDALPFLPFDDIAVTVILVNWFIGRIEKKYPAVKADKRYIK